MGRRERGSPRAFRVFEEFGDVGHISLRALGDLLLFLLVGFVGAVGGGAVVGVGLLQEVVPFSLVNLLYACSYGFRMRGMTLPFLAGSVGFVVSVQYEAWGKQEELPGPGGFGVVVVLSGGGEDVVAGLGDDLGDEAAALGWDLLGGDGVGQDFIPGDEVHALEVGELLWSGGVVGGPVASGAGWFGRSSPA